MAGRINVDKVIDLVSGEVRSAVLRLGERKAPAGAAGGVVLARCAEHHRPAPRLTSSTIDGNALADWAEAHGTALHLLVRAGDYVFPGAPIALAKPAVPGLAEAIDDATAVAADRVSSDDLEYAVRQLVEVAVRALSPGINDPHTAMSALDRLGAALCDVVALRLPSGVFLRSGHLRAGGAGGGLRRPGRRHVPTSSGRTPAGSAAVLIRMLESADIGGTVRTRPAAPRRA